jgi:hypothetical protein
MAVASGLRAASWFPDTGIRIVDLGLTPAQAKAARIPETNGLPLGDDVSLPLPEDEAGSLRQGSRWDLEALRPSRLLSVAWRGFARTAEMASDERWNDDGIWLAGYGWGPGLWLVDDGWHAHDHWAGSNAAMLDAGASDSFG